MSKIWKKIINIPSWISVHVGDWIVTVEWPNWKLSINHHPKVEISVDGSEVTTSVQSTDDWNLWWLTRTLVNNMVEGIHTPFIKKLLVFGVWYTAKLNWSSTLEMTLGYSHKTIFELPSWINCSMEKDSKGSDIIVLSSIDKQLLWQIASDIRILKKPEPYKWKWIRYIDEVVKLKAWKAAKK